MRFPVVSIICGDQDFRYYRVGEGSGVGSAVNTLNMNRGKGYYNTRSLDSFLFAWALGIYASVGVPTSVELHAFLGYFAIALPTLLITDGRRRIVPYVLDETGRSGERAADGLDAERLDELDDPCVRDDLCQLGSHAFGDRPDIPFFDAALFTLCRTSTGGEVFFFPMSGMDRMSALLLGICFGSSDIASKTTPHISSSDSSTLSTRYLMLRESVVSTTAWTRTLF
jgi:hypothetical protein